MTLDPAQLASDLADVFDSMPETPRACADAIADIFHAYCSAATFGASTPVIPGANKAAFADTIYAAIASPAAGLPALISAAFSTAVAAYWLGVPVVGPQTGATTGCPGAPAIAVALVAVFSNLANTAATAGAGVAAALHAGVSTVQAAVAPPPGMVLPIL